MAEITINQATSFWNLNLYYYYSVHLLIIDIICSGRRTAYVRVYTVFTVYEYNMEHSRVLHWFSVIQTGL